MKMIKIPKDLRSLNRELLFEKSTAVAATLLKDYDPFVHKGNRGHLGLFAGSEGMAGAAILSSLAAIKSGLGKLTVHLPAKYHVLIHQSIPEALVKDINNKISFEQFNAIAIGPALGLTPSSKVVLIAAMKSMKPMVLDADALTLLSMHPELLVSIPTGSLLTPHLGEWERMFGKSNDDKERIITSVNICNKLNINILIKGHISVLVTPDDQVHYNGTGNAGMAKAGSGDVLTGILGGLLAQGYAAKDAGILGMYLHGLAGDLASTSLGEDFMTATDQIQHLSGAFKRLRNSRTNP